MFKIFNWFKINRQSLILWFPKYPQYTRADRTTALSAGKLSCLILFILLFQTLIISARPISGQLFTEIGETIELNQVGFYPWSPKLAVITGAGTQTHFYILKAGSNDTLFRGTLSKARKSLNSAIIARTADFTGFNTTGSFYVAVPGINNSGVFKISDSVYHDLAIASLKGFYYQRASMPLIAQYAGKWARAEGHPDTAVFVHSSAVSLLRPEGAKISVSRGWYDAGDYNKYIVNSGISTSTLLSAFEDHTVYFKQLNTNIPESSNAVPDILDEAIYNLRWMLTMQDPNDGGVYHKCTNALFDKMVMPDKAIMPRLVVQKSTAATLDFAAVMAQAARILKPYKLQLPGLADSCLKSSYKAWSWANANQHQFYDQTAMNKLYQPKILTGDYGDKNVDDEFFWAAAELFATTKEQQFYATLLKGIDRPAVIPGWSSVQLLGYYALQHPNLELPAFASKSISALKIRLVKLADDLILGADKNVFYAVIGRSPKDFAWGSNSLAANQAIELLYVYKITGQNKYLRFSLLNLNYLLGQNATGYCFVTGFGAKSPQHPHHRPSVSDGIVEPVPGLLVGGPNPGMQDGQKYPFSSPETAYFDNDSAYACNEIAINWNAPLVYLVNAVEALNSIKPNTIN